MGKFARKTAHKKSVKEEKAKIKFKVSHKTTLPKGQNITNTSFKVKKIVVKSQLKEHEGEVVSKSNLNVKELLSRLHHHNAPLRVSSLSSLSEIVNTHKNTVLNLHLPALLHASSNLILDKDQDVRTEAIKFLSVILTKSTESQLAPLFEIIIKYLACAMTHIDANIRRSSLEMLDILVSKHANLTARHCQSVILPAFLDLISTKFVDSERKLSLDYNNKMSTNIWRIKVLARLQALLNAIVNIRLVEKSDTEKSEYIKKIKWTADKPVFASLYHSPFNSRNYLELSEMQTSITKTSPNQNNEIQTYTEGLLPLLIDIFIEVAPQKQKTKNQRTGQHLSSDAAVLLRFIADIILLLWQIFELSDSPAYLKRWFCETYSSSILNHLIVGRFPYAINEHTLESQAKNTKQKNHSNLPGLSAEYSKCLTDMQCTYLNSTLCCVFLLLCHHDGDDSSLKIIIRYICDLLQSNQHLDRETISKLLDSVDTIFSSDFGAQQNKFDYVQFIRIIKKLYDESASKNDTYHNYVTQKTFNYLYKVVLNSKVNSLKSEPTLNSWLDSLPALLIEKKITFHMVKCIANIARCKEPTFINSLDGYMEMILDNLPHLNIINENKQDRAEGKKLIANLLYFVQTWDCKFVNGLKKAVDNGYFTGLSKHIKDIIDCKLSN